MALTYSYRQLPQPPVQQQQPQQFYQQQGFINNNLSPYAASNASIDRIIDQVHVLASEINDFGKMAGKNVGTIKENGGKTISDFEKAFSNLSAGAHTVEGLALDRFGDFPTTACYVVIICALIAICAAFIFFSISGGFYLYQHYRQKKAYTKGRKPSPTENGILVEPEIVTTSSSNVTEEQETLPPARHAVL